MFEIGTIVETKSGTQYRVTGTGDYGFDRTVQAMPLVRSGISYFKAESLKLATPTETPKGYASDCLSSDLATVETELYGSFLPADGHVEEPAFLPKKGN